MHNLSIFWFRQDLRIEDNLGLIKAINLSKQVLPIFIFDKNILKTNPKSDPRVWFIFDSVEKLNKDLKSLWAYLQVYHWKPQEIIPDLILKYKIDGIFTNRSYWTYWTWRDKLIKEYCIQNWINFYSISDFLLVEPEEIDAYKVFTPYYKKWLWIVQSKNIITQKIEKITSPNIELNSLSKIKEEINPWENKYWPINLWEKRLNTLEFNNYDESRNLPYIDWTSMFSTYIRFWILSIRQIYNKLTSLNNSWANTIISELAWREFWQHIIYHFPLAKSMEFQEKRRKIKWQNDTKLFEAWKEWKTWYPIVDAGMRQLKQENWMHNRVRMIVASFLTKDLLIDWRWWEQYFKELLIDYDENVNIWNWQWSASVWADPKPLRIFNPILQSQRFDPECKYITRYVPELKFEPLAAIHDPIKYKLNYHKPIVDHYTNSKIAKQLYFWE